MSDGFVQASTDGAGKEIDSWTEVISGSTVYRQRIVQAGYPLNAQVPASVSVSTSGTLVLNANAARTGLVLVNCSTGAVMSLALGTTAPSVNSGITLQPNGGAWSMDQFSFTRSAVYAAASVASSTLAVQEFA